MTDADLTTEPNRINLGQTDREQPLGTPVVIGWSFNALKHGTETVSDLKNC